MSTLAKVLVVLNLVLAACLVASLGAALGQADTWKSKYEKEEDRGRKDRARAEEDRSQLTTKLQQANAQVEALAGEKANLTKENNRLMEEATSLRAAAQAHSEQLSVSVRTNERMTNTLTANRDLIATQEQHIAQQREQITGLQEKVSQLSQILSGKEIALERAQAQVKQTSEQLASAQETIRTQEFSLNVFRDRFPGVEVATQPAHSGRILTANAEANVYTISLGVEDGVRPGFTYTVSRGPRYVATIQIDDVQNKQASGRALRDQSSGPIQVGDTISNAK